MAAIRFSFSCGLRDHATERDKLYIAAMYYMDGTGELEKATQTYQLWMQSYPRDFIAHANASIPYSILGQYEKAVEATREALKLNSESVSLYVNLVALYVSLNRFPEAQDVANQALAHKLDNEYLHTNLYSLAFVQGDSAAMAQQATWFEGKAGAEHEILGSESATEDYFGRLDKARELTRRAIASAESAKNKEAAASWSAGDALQEALFGNDAAAKERANTALSLAPGSRDAEHAATLALALAGDGTGAKAVTESLNKSFPLSTLTQSVWLPTIRGQLEINRKAPASAVELLQAAAPYELGFVQFNSSCAYPAYIRGQAYLAAGQGASAAAEFQKILDHRGIVRNCPTGALAHLGLARAYVAQKDTAKAKAAYQDFLTLWKDADPDIPILKQAKAELAGLE
jgi:predicted Zn-dependent protease